MNLREPSSQHRQLILEIDMTGTLVIDLVHPSEAFLYRATKPTVAINGVAQRAEPWGTRRFELPDGPHRINIHVPYVMPRKAGRAELDVTVTPGETTHVEYMAPTITFAKGSLGAPGEQVSYGYAAVKKWNVVAVIAIVVVVAAALAFS